MGRDYHKNPLKYGELIDSQELFEVYITNNNSRKATAVYFNTTEAVISRSLSAHGIKKDPKQRYENYKKTNLEKYGVENIFEKADYIKQCTKKKLGVSNSSKLSATIKKRQQTCLDKYGTKTASESAEIKTKTLKTMQERFGGNAPICSKEIKDKIRKTNLKKYGVEFVGSTKQVKQKRKETCLEKYGANSYMATEDFREKTKETLLEKYGVENVGLSEELQDKAKQTVLERYGVDNVFADKNVQEKIKDTMVERYGCEHPIQNKEIYQKIRKTLKKNNNFKESKEETFIYETLLKKFPDTIRQYYEERYPFNCDFYIPELDLFIEYQGYQGHGGHPYDPNSSEDINKVILWEQKAQEVRQRGKIKNQYSGYIQVWTVKDVEKRAYAKQNKLNWLEFFSVDEFLAWFDAL